MTAILCLATWLHVRDDPTERGHVSHYPGEHGAASSTSLLQGLVEVLSYRNIWILTAVPIGFSGAVLTFAGLWLSVLGALLEMAGETARAVAITPDEPLDMAWAEPAAFDGCSTQGQAKPGDPQPVRIVRRTNPAQGAST